MQAIHLTWVTDRLLKRILLPYMLILLDEAFALNTNTNKQKQF